MKTINKSITILTLLALSVPGCATNSTVLHTTPIVERKPVKQTRPATRSVRKQSPKIDYRRYAHLDFKKHFDYAQLINSKLASYNCRQLRKEAAHTDGVVRAMKPQMGDLRGQQTINQQKAMNVAFFYNGLNQKLRKEFKKRCNS